MKEIYLLLVSILFFASHALANNNLCQLEPVTQKIPQIDTSLAGIKKQTALPVIFPQLLPKNNSNTSLFIYVEPIQANGKYTIDIDSTADCHGTHYCNFGAVQAEKFAKPILYTDMQNRNITVPVKLTPKISGYFTPGHAMGSYFPANIQWQNKEILFSITYDTTKENLIAMANSAIEVTSK